MFIAIQVVAELKVTGQEAREELERNIKAILGCDNTESDCPMVFFASTVVDSAATALMWLE